MKAPFKTPVESKIVGHTMLSQTEVWGVQVGSNLQLGPLSKREADFIATAINSHERDQDTIKALVEALEHERHCRFCAEDGCESCFECTALNALALAKGAKP
jgi:hypothetical protein